MITEVTSVVVGTAHLPSSEGRDGHTYDAWYGLAREAELHPILRPHILLRRVDLEQAAKVSNSLMNHPAINAVLGELGELQYDIVVRQFAERGVGANDIRFHDVFNVIYFNHAQAKRLAACGLSFATMDAQGNIIPSAEFVIPEVGSTLTGVIHSSYDDGEKLWNTVEIADNFVMSM